MSRRLLASVACVALAACGVARNVTGTEALAACTTCHGDAARAGDALSRAAPPVSTNGGDGGAHVAHLSRNVPCGSCHVVPSSTSHSNGVVEVRFSGLATANGATPSLSGATCSGVYCHGATLGAGGKGIPPTWSGAPLACDACHGAPPPSHAATSTSCNACHPGTVKPDGTIDLAGGLHVNGHVEATGGHAPGWADPSQHGPAALQGLGSCRSCHGADLAGGTAGVSCDACHAANGYPTWQTNCTFCHGTKTAAYDPTALASAAPPRGTAGETATTDVAVGAHRAHLTAGALGGAVACTACHVVPTDLSHLDGSATVTFGTAATRGGAAPVWNGASCATTYCHGATIAGGTNKAPSWTGGPAQAACGTCHGVPPPAPHSTSTACGTCHTGYTSTTVNAALHLNGTIDATSPHPSGWSAKEQHGYTANRSGLTSCKSCHGTNLDGAGGTGPSCASCHAAAGIASWWSSCTFCHGDRATGVAAPPVDTQGGTSTANVSVGAHAAHLGTVLMATPACTTCHPDRTGSNVITDPAHLDGNGVAEVALGALARTGGAAATYTRTSATAASCNAVYCHGAFTGATGGNVSWTSTTNLTCTSCHGLPPATGHHADHASRSCGDCHPGYTRTSVNRATHVDGARQVGNLVTAWNPTTRQCTGCHGNETW